MRGGVVAARLTASARLAGLAETIAASGAERVSAGAVVDALGDAGLGLTLLLLMLPVFITIPGLPVGIVFGFLVCVLGWQIMAGAHSLRLPDSVRRRGLPAAQVGRVLRGSVPWLVRAERWLRPGRLGGLLTAPAQRALGLVLLLMGLALAVPIPFGNFPPAFAVVALGLGLMERDGGAVLTGLVLAALAAGWIVVLVATSAELLARAAAWLGL